MELGRPDVDTRSRQPEHGAVHVQHGLSKKIAIFGLRSRRILEIPERPRRRSLLATGRGAGRPRLRHGCRESMFAESRHAQFE